MKSTARGIMASAVLLGTSVFMGCTHEYAAPAVSRPPPPVAITPTTTTPPAQSEVNLDACETNFDNLETALLFDCPRE
jgi:hypothetical protein